MVTKRSEVVSITNKKLSSDQVRVIRHLYKTSDVSMRELGRMFKVSATQIGKILKRKSRSDIKDWISEEDFRLNSEAEINQPAPTKDFNKLTDDEVAQIRERYAEGGSSYRSLAKEYGISFTQIRRIISYTQRKSV